MGTTSSTDNFGRRHAVEVKATLLLSEQRYQEALAIFTKLVGQEPERETIG